ncbi:hypothetical protein CBS147355_6078 [Penicillium roqueforti]|nr:hypothetical protein CBS147355_6078 [Penicillium roqueforti]
MPRYWNVEQPISTPTLNVKTSPFGIRVREVGYRLGLRRKATPLGAWTTACPRIPYILESEVRKSITDLAYLGYTWYRHLHSYGNIEVTSF